MKRWLSYVLVLLLLLSGCSGEPSEETQASTVAPSETTVPETVPSIYDPENPIEELTEGAVRAYSLDEDCSSIAFMGEQLLLFSCDGYGPTRLTRLDSENYSVETTVELLGSVSPENGGLQITARKLGYYSDIENAVVILDSMLREISRVPMPEDMEGLPVIREDMREAYYCTSTDVRVVDLESGISRLLRQRDCLGIWVQDILFDDTILVCTVEESEDEYVTEFISAETGETLGVDTGFISIVAWEDAYFLQRMEGIVLESLFAEADEPLQCIVPEESAGTLYSALAMNALAAVSHPEDGGISLQLYDLGSGKNTASIQIESMEALHCITADPGGRYLWFLSSDSQGYVTLYSWDTSLSPTEDETVYTGLRYAAESPDEDGLTKCRAWANNLERQYGVEILLEKEPLPTADYAFTYEYHVQAFNSALETLENTLASFPEGFFTTVGQVSDSGKLHIGLVRSMQGRTRNAPEDAAGAQYWVGGKACIALAIGDTLGPSFIHALSHVLDTYILNETLSYDDWDSLNPDGFQYDENYSDYKKREDTTWLEGEDRVFVDAFAMTFAKEDRAQILEYAMQEGNAELFQSETMQNKLLQICKGIRDAFGWKKDERTFPWEQYLEKSLAYVNK